MLLELIAETLGIVTARLVALQSGRIRSSQRCPVDGVHTATSTMIRHETFHFGACLVFFHIITPVAARIFSAEIPGACVGHVATVILDFVADSGR